MLAHNINFCHHFHGVHKKSCNPDLNRDTCTDNLKVMLHSKQNSCIFKGIIVGSTLLSVSLVADKVNDDNQPAVNHDLIELLYIWNWNSIWIVIGWDGVCAHSCGRSL